jgi:hypothetical protein
MLVGLLVQKVWQLEEKTWHAVLKEMFFGAVHCNLHFIEKAALHWNRDFEAECGNLNC